MSALRKNFEKAGFPLPITKPATSGYPEYITVIPSDEDRAAVAMLASLKPFQQAQLLAVPGMICALCKDRALTSSVVKIFQALEPCQRANLLTTSQAVLWLSAGGEASAVVEMLKELEPHQLATALSLPGAIFRLNENGQALAVVEMLESLGPFRSKVERTLDPLSGQTLGALQSPRRLY
jgi:hypothetical protein